MDGLDPTHNTVILTSTDGFHWSSVSDVFTNASLTGVARGNSQWLAVGRQDLGLQTYGLILTSTDGSTWTQLTGFLNMPLTGIAWSDGKWVAVGIHSGINNNESVILISTDGSAWTPSFYSGVFLSGVAGVGGIAKNSSQWVAVGSDLDGDSVILVSNDDGGHWGRVENTPEDTTLNDVVWSGSQWVVVGQNNEGYSVILTSTDGATWNIASSGSQPASALFGVGV